MSRIKNFVRKAGLPFAMILGVGAYYLFIALPLSAEVHRLAYMTLTEYIQPILIFTMLLLSFMKVKVSDMKPQRWHLWLLFMQTGSFIICSSMALLCPSNGIKILIEGAMLAFVCPTATAAAVVTGKLGGSVSGVVTYLMICNLMVSIIAPAVLPLVEPHSGMSFFPSFLKILRKVFPLLICPLLIAQFIRYCLPKVYRRVMRYPDLAFHVWLPALTLAITVTVRSIVHSTIDWRYMVGLAAISAICCLIQFYLGQWLGSKFDVNHKISDASIKITAGQAFGQKNTVFVIWLGLVFLDPVTSVVGGFYSVWHNCVNSWQLLKSKND